MVSGQRHLRWRGYQLSLVQCLARLDRGIGPLAWSLSAAVGRLSSHVRHTLRTENQRIAPPRKLTITLLLARWTFRSGMVHQVVPPMAADL